MAMNGFSVLAKAPINNNTIGSSNTGTSNSAIGNGSASGLSSSDLSSLISFANAHTAEQQALTKLERKPSNGTEADLQNALQDMINENDPSNASTIDQGLARLAGMKARDGQQQLPQGIGPVAAQPPGSDPQSAGIAQFQKGENELAYAKKFDQNGHIEAREAKQAFEKGDFAGALEHMKNEKFNFDNAKKTGREAQTDMRQGRAEAFGSLNADGAAADQALRGALNAGPKFAPVDEDLAPNPRPFINKLPVFNRTSKL